jgi:hypothetical protein
MSTITFDKLAYVEHLKAGGIDEKHARVHALALDDAFKDAVATKSDMKELRSDIRELELRMTIKLGTMMLAIAGISSGIVIFALKFLLKTP